MRRVLNWLSAGMALAGLAIVAVSPKALEAQKTASCPRCFFDFTDMMRSNKDGYFPYTPATTLMRGLRASIEDRKSVV